MPATIHYDQPRVHLSLGDVRSAHKAAADLAEAILTQDAWSTSEWHAAAETIRDLLDGILIRHGVVEKRQYGFIELRSELEI